MDRYINIITYWYMYGNTSHNTEYCNNYVSKSSCMLFQRSPKLICNAAFFLKFNPSNYSFITLEKLNILLKYSLNKWIVLKYYKKLELSSCYHDVAAFLPSWLPNVVLRFKIWGNLRDEAFTFQNNISIDHEEIILQHSQKLFFFLISQGS